jgi:uncharacterized Zn finger protein
MVKIEGRKQEELVIPPLQASFLRFVKVIRSSITNLYINNLKCQENGLIEEAKIEIKDEVSLQLSIHTIDEPFVKAFV